MYSLNQLAKRVRRIIYEEETDRYPDADIYRWINDGIQELWKALRSNKNDVFVKIMKSTDSSSFIFDRTYDPATSLKIAINTTSYTLPPDFVGLKYIRTIDTNIKFVEFIPSDVASSIFDILKEPGLQGNTEFVYDIVGNDLIIAPAPISSFDIEIGYEYRIAPLKILEGQTSGTCSISAGGTSVTGVSSKFSYASLGQRFIPGTLDEGKIYPYIIVIGSDTALTLSGPVSNIAVAAGTTYTIEDALPLQMADFDNAIVEYAVLKAHASDKSHASVKESYEFFQKGETKSKESSNNKVIGASMVEPYM